MTVLDTSCVVDLLLGEDVADQVLDVLRAEGEAAAPELVVFEALAVLRRGRLRGEIGAERAAGAVKDLGDVSLALFPAMPLRERAWELRDSMTTADALFVALAERLSEPLITKDRRLAKAARAQTKVKVQTLGDPPARR